jgi:signal transduction histidine kinase/CheY-like chemotaxis protein
VPADIAAVFEAAEDVVGRYFSERVFDPERGTIEICGERYVLVRAASLSVEFVTVVRSLFGEDRQAEADAFARNILFDLAHAIGKQDAKSFHAKMGLDDPIARLSAGPVHFAHCGWAFVDISPESRPQPNEEFMLVYDHPYSFEASAWVDARDTTTFPACVMNAGYSSGWCSASFGLTLISTEILCRARGDEACRFVMAPPSRIEAVLERYKRETPSIADRMVVQQTPDLFARKRIEEALRESRDELDLRVKMRTSELVRANALLQEESAQRAAVERRLAQSQKLEAVGRLAGGVAHDFNNLLGVVLGRCSMIQRRVTEDDPLWQDMEAIRLACRQGASLTRHLIAFSRGDAGAASLLDLNDVVRTFEKGLLTILGEDVELSLTLTPANAFLLGDGSQLEQVLLNLVVNARDAMPDGGTLDIRTDVRDLSPTSTATGDLPAGRYVVLSVADTGGGMDEATALRMFDPFFTTKTLGGGSGLGLSTVYGIVKQSRGGISVTSRRGAGTTLTLFFPHADTAHEADTRSVDGFGAAPASVRRAEERGVQILLVEDQAALRSTMEEALLEAGHKVVATGDPLMAAALVEHGDLDLDVLVTDIVMPKLGGRQLAARIREKKPLARILFISGYDQDAEAQRGGQVTDIDAPLLAKPFGIDELLRAIRAIL